MKQWRKVTHENARSQSPSKYFLSFFAAQTHRRGRDCPTAHSHGLSLVRFNSTRRTFGSGILYFLLFYFLFSLLFFFFRCLLIFYLKGLDAQTSETSLSQCHFINRALECSLQLGRAEHSSC